MHTRPFSFLRPLLLLALAIFPLSPVSAQLLGTRFTYQGYLEDGGLPKNSAIDLAINVFDADSGGNFLGATRLEAVPVSNGVFTVMLDFGAGTFLGTPVFLEIHVREDDDGDMASSDNFVMLSPRQELTPTPYALHAESVSLDAVTSAEIADGSISAGDLATSAVTSVKLASGAVTSSKIAANSINGAHVQDGSLSAADVNTTSVSIGLQRRLQQACPAGQMLSDIAADGAPACTAPVLDSTQQQAAVTGQCLPLGQAAITSINPDGSVGCSYFPDLTPAPTAPVELAVNVGPHLSVLHDPNIGPPYLTIAYYKSDTQSLALRFCSQPNPAICDQGGVIEIDDPANDVGQYVSLRQIGSRLVMAYYDASADDLKLALCKSADPDCSEGAQFIRSIDTAGDVGRFVELLEVRSSPNAAPIPAMVYLDASNNRYKYAVCDDATCASSTIRNLDGFSASGITLSEITSDRASPPSLAATTPRFVLIADSGTLRLVTCGDSACASFTADSLPFGNDRRSPLALQQRYQASGDFAGFFVVHASQATLDLRTTSCLGVPCSDALAVGNGGVAGQQASLHQSPSGLPVRTTGLNTGIFVRALQTRDPFHTRSGSISVGQVGALESVPLRWVDSVAQANFPRVAVVYQEPSDGSLKMQLCWRQDCSEL